MNHFQKVFLFYPIKLLSLLPLQALYFIFYPCYFLLFYIFRYRRKITNQNLSNAFPNKSKKEISTIEKKYYKYLTKLFSEFVKGISISEKELRKRVVLHDRDVLQNIYNNHGAAIVLLGHYGNWELIALASELIAPHHFNIIYKPLTSQFSNHLMQKIRTRFGADVTPMEFTYTAIKNLQNEKVLFTLVNDQSPSNIKNVHWINFLNQQTAFMSGALTITKRLNIPVCFLEIKSYKSGFYELYPKVIIEDNTHHSTEGVIKIYAQLLEDNIRQKPELWLWSHRRWKHKAQ
ncbi:MAG: lysophospholipid acyltransferase family protein [Bacteroidia bacterium]|nr:lysophospholipid acyltransferase family protein [Bacteroidia bacterium]